MKRILLVDDRDEIRRAFAGLLAAEGYEVVEASDGAQVADRVRRFSPDLILVDIIMPVMDGFHVLESLKKDPVTRPIPVIVVSAANVSANVMRARNLGASDFVLKSAPFEEILGRVQRVFDGTAAEAAPAAAAAS